MCKRVWPTWRSVITHYSKSTCHSLTSTTQQSSSTEEQEASVNIIDPENNRVTTTSTIVGVSEVVDEESEMDEDQPRSISQRRKRAPKRLTKDKNINKNNSLKKSPSEHEKDNLTDSDVNGDDEAITSRSTSDNLSMTSSANENTSNMATTIQDNQYYCKICGAGGWAKSVGLSQHMRHRHKSEYNATIEVASNKRRWTSDEILLLAELEIKIPSKDGIYINQVLAKKFPSRTLESIKSRRKNPDYRILLQRLRAAKTNTITEGLNCTYDSSAVNSLTVVNDNINDKEGNNNYLVVNTNSNNSPGDPSSQSVVDSTVYPDIRQYVKNTIIGGRVQVCATMDNALLQFVNDLIDTDPVEESLKGIHEVLENVRPSKKAKDEKLNVGSKPRNAKSKKKAQRYAQHQRLFNKDRSKLASEIFDGIDTSANKPTISSAFEHFRKIWESDTSNTSSTNMNASVGATTLLAPISREEVAWAISQTKNSTAVGPDRVSIDSVRKIARNELWCAFNIWIGKRKIPEQLKNNRTVLLPKGKEGLENIKNWRPITIASILLRLYNKILARRMQTVFRTSLKQKGFKPINGVGQNVATLHHLLRHARTQKNNLFVCLLDVSKAFDSVPHESILRALSRNNSPSEFIKLISNEYENSHTTLSCADGDSPLIYIRRGVKQGDPMSSLLFNLVIDELFEVIGDRFGYELDGIGSINARAFADDIALFSGSEVGMQELLSTTEKFLDARGLELNADKCISICLRKAGKAKKSQVADSSVNNPPKFTVNRKLIRLLGINEKCRYLGVQYTPLGAVNPLEAVSDLKIALRSLSEAALKPQQKLVMLREHLIPRFIFSFINTECYPKLMGTQDRLIRRWIKETLKLPQSLCTDYIYLPIKEGGLGVGKLYDIIGTAKVHLHASLTKSNDPCMKYLVEIQGSSMHARWCHAMKLSSRPSAVEFKQRKEMATNEARKRLNETVHGSGSELFRNSPITNQWLSGHTRVMKGSTFIRAIQMRTNTTPTLVSTTRGRDASKTCRRCGLADETLLHILQTCPITQGMRCTRHNNVCRKVSEKLRSKGYQVHQEKGVSTPELQTLVSRPDIIAVQGDKALILDVTCIYENHSSCFHDAYRRKVDRYKPLIPSVKQLYNVNAVELHGLCVGSRGCYDSKQLAIWHSIGFTGFDLSTLAIGVIEDSLRTISLFNNANRLRV